MHRDGPAMVLAGPGAGKTYVITNRVKALIDEYGVKPEQILVVTFSKAAAVEMKERFEMMTGGPAQPAKVPLNLPLPKVRLSDHDNNP